MDDIADRTQLLNKLQDLDTRTGLQLVILTGLLGHFSSTSDYFHVALDDRLVAYTVKQTPSQCKFDVSPISQSPSYLGCMFLHYFAASNYELDYILAPSFDKTDVCESPFRALSRQVLIADLCAWSRRSNALF